jgi:hypothetical protein
METPQPVAYRQLDDTEAIFIGGPWADQRRPLTERPDTIELEHVHGRTGKPTVGHYDRSDDTPRGAAVYCWRYVPNPNGRPPKGAVW